MSKRLPYFQFEPAEWLAGDIMFCSLSAKGLFTDIMTLYWQRDCKLTLEQAQKRFNYENEFNELISEEIIKIKDGFIVIEFLDNQMIKAIEKSSVNSINGAKGGRPKKQTETEKKPNALISVIENESEKKPIREDKIKEDNIIEYNNNIISKESAFEIFWDTYSKKVEKTPCETKFLKLTKKDIENILLVVKDYVISTPDVKYRKNPLTWLNKKCWEDEIASENKSTKLTFEQIKEEQRKNMAF